MWPISYFKRKSEERRQALKEELYAELQTELFSKFDEVKKGLLKSTKKELDKVCQAFTESIDKKKKGLEAQVDRLRKDVTKYVTVSKDAVAAAQSVQEHSEIIEAAAKSAEESVQEMRSIADSIDAKIEEYKNLAVQQATEAVDSVMNKAVRAAREEYKMNLEESVDLLKETNSRKMDAWLIEVNQKLDAAVQKLEETNTEHDGTLKSLTEQSQSVLTQLQDDTKYLADTFRYIRRNIPLVAYALQLSDQQKHLLRELFSKKYAGDLEQLRKDLKKKSNSLQGKDIAPDELDLRYAEHGVKEMIGYVKRQKRNLRALHETVERIDNVYTRDSRSSGRDRRR